MLRTPNGSSELRCQGRGRRTGDDWSDHWSDDELKLGAPPRRRVPPKPWRKPTDLKRPNRGLVDLSGLYVRFLTIARLLDSFV